MSASVQLMKIRHSLAHIMAQAVLEIRPGSKLGFGPAIEDGFYYDFLLSSPLNENDFPEIESRMKRIIASDVTFVREDLAVAEALVKLADMDEPYKLEFARELVEKRGEKRISFYRSGNFVDMCDGPHVARSGEIPTEAFKLRSVAGAYWRGDSANQVMSRVYAWAYGTHQELREALAQHEAGVQRDHRKLGRELEIFHFDEEVGQGLPLWLPNGTVVRDELEKFIKEFEFRGGYKRVSTPQIAHGSLYECSGHLEHYAEGMFPPMMLSESPHHAKKQPYYLRPMNCPHHHRIFMSKPRSHRDLPLRLAEYGQIYRYENSGALAGLMRARGCCQNDAHIYCAENQIRAEMLAVLRMYQEAYRVLNIHEFRLRLSKWDPSDVAKYVNSADKWEWSQNLLREILLESGLPFFEAEGEAAFYGPKIDVQFKFASGKEETASTIQLDFVAAERMGLHFIGSDGERHRPYVIHRAPLGSHERFVAFLIEKHAGAFPLWLAPEQICVLPIAEAHHAYAWEIQNLFRENFVRVEVDDSNESFSKRVRAAVLRKVPYVVVVGDKERETSQVAVRVRGSKEQFVVAKEEFLEKVLAQIKSRK